MKIYLTALVKATKGNAEKMKPLLFELVRQTLTEEACLQYELFQSDDDEHQFIFHETWRDQQGMDQHNKSKGITDFVREASPIMDGGITVYKTSKIR